MIQWAIDIHGNIKTNAVDLPLLITEVSVTRNVETVKLLGIDIVPTNNWTYRHEKA